MALQLQKLPVETQEVLKLAACIGNQFDLKKAKAATAYETASKYFTAGLAALPENGWEHHYNLTLALYTEAAEIEYLTAHFEQAEQLSEIVLQHAQDLLQKVKMYEIKIYFYIAQNQMLAAIDICLQVLEFLSEPLFKEPPWS